MLNKKTINTKIELSKKLSVRLLEILQDQEVILKCENKKITQDTQFSIEYDFEFIRRYLAGYVASARKIFEKKLKAKGSILIILSYNEPFILSIVPVLNAILAGNDVVVKPSGKCYEFFKKIWFDSGLIKELDLPVKLVEKFNESEIRTVISLSDCVYFFGSSKNAEKIYKICSELFVEFIPEIETSDCKVFKFDNPSDELMEKDCESTITQSFSHAGQTCQRISGIFVQENNFISYCKKIKEIFLHLKNNQSIDKLIEHDFVADRLYEQKIIEDICNSNHAEIIKFEDHPSKIVINPNTSSEFVKNGYFYPVLWIVSFKDLDSLCAILNDRKFYLGLNICTDDNFFIDSLISKTRFTRYTVNVTHTDIELDDGWGGRWPSGSGGYKSWIEHFSVSFNIIQNNKTNSVESFAKKIQ